MYDRKYFKLISQNTFELKSSAKISLYIDGSKIQITPKLNRC